MPKVLMKKVITYFPKTVDAQSTVEFFDKVEKAFPRALKIHIFLDRSGYHRSPCKNAC